MVIGANIDAVVAADVGRRSWAAVEQRRDARVEREVVVVVGAAEEGQDEGIGGAAERAAARRDQRDRRAAHARVLPTTVAVLSVKLVEALALLKSPAPPLSV